jgi:hypothetical protein
MSFSIYFSDSMLLAQAPVLVKLNFFSKIDRAHLGLQNEPESVIIGLLDVKICEKLLYGAHWSVELQLQKVGQRGNWWREGNRTVIRRKTVKILSIP